MPLTNRLWRSAATAALLFALNACAATVSPSPTTREVTPSGRQLSAAPGPAQPLVVAVYGYQDQTGQMISTQSLATFSHAVTQGAASVLLKALQDAGRGKWFKVVEREHLNNLVTERQIVREQRKAMKVPDNRDLPPMLYAQMLLEGGVIGYDSNTVTGGLGANYLGIGGNAQYQEDIVTVYLRAVSTQTGEVIGSVMAKKKIISYGLQGSVYKFVALNKLLQGEAGFTANEPVQIALRQAIEKAVTALIVDGARRNLWQFADRAAGQAFLDRWAKDEDDDDATSTIPAAAAQAAATPASVQMPRP
jgi:curli production assembly/transport component CsgG